MFNEKNYKEAFFLISQAAENQEPAAQYLLGSFFKFGLGTKRSHDKAREWYWEAAKLSGVSVKI